MEHIFLLVAEHMRSEERGRFAPWVLRTLPAFSITWIFSLSSPIFALPVACALMPCGAFPFALKGQNRGLAFVVGVGGREAI